MGAPPAPSTDVARLFREHGTFVRRTLRRLGLTETDADNLCQDVFLVVVRRLDDVGNVPSVRGWLYGITIRVASRHRRRGASQREPPTETLPEISTGDRGPDEALEAKEARRLLERALAALDHDKRAVFVLFEIDGLSMVEVARALNCPVQTAYSRLHVAREKVARACAP